MLGLFGWLVWVLDISRVSFPQGWQLRAGPQGQNQGYFSALLGRLSLPQSLIQRPFWCSMRPRVSLTSKRPTGHTDSNPFSGSLRAAVRHRWMLWPSGASKCWQCAGGGAQPRPPGATSAQILCTWRSMHMWLAVSNTACQGIRHTSPPAAGCWSSPAALLMPHGVSVQGGTKSPCLHG